MAAFGAARNPRTDLPRWRVVLTVCTKQQSARGFSERRDWRMLHLEFVTP